MSAGARAAARGRRFERGKARRVLTNVHGISDPDRKLSVGFRVDQRVGPVGLVKGSHLSSCPCEGPLIKCMNGTGRFLA